MAPPPSYLYTLSFAIALFATILVAATLRLLAILPNSRTNTTIGRKKPLATRVLIVLGSGGHTREMFYLLKDLDTRKYTHRTYVISSGDAFSAQRAVDFEQGLEEREQAKAREKKKKQQEEDGSSADAKIQITDADGTTHARGMEEPRPAYSGAKHYNIATVPRARNIHQPLLTTPLSALHCLWKSFDPLLSAPVSHPPTTSYEAAAADLPNLIITNGPATAVIMVLASLILRFFDVKGANSRGCCKTIYVESFARVKTLSLSGKLLLRVVDRFLVQWEELEAVGGRAEYWGVLV
ncbi:oligosaccharide biosynthesis protein Alg14 like protein [Decorospora gaudefroyi]|uniref:UDP-N-acetylglucosamine transferase subunit ALG14 n=1 Tax=Decorospora gaudefroyi TaxID=184978 RepID=A0A6A5KWQ6_9PLEO|nr:oligosaccharide biosynthesis protein Alg14 like protein [Decorospora gaudefroyi]